MFNYKLFFIILYILISILYTSINLIIHAVVMLASIL